MDRKNWAWVIFGIMVVAQLAIAFQMILKHENTLREGKVFKFKTAPVDPSDPFRGKYITLNFEARNWKTNDTTWHGRTKCFVELKEDENGFAKIAGVTKTPPTQNIHFVQAKVSVIATMREEGKEVNELFVEFPFQQFFLQENKAPLAEAKFFEITRDTTLVSYALVSVNKGSAVIKDVFIGENSVKKILEE